MKQKDDTMRPTPETDANKLDHTAPVWLCERLERQRDEALELMLELRDALESMWSSKPGYSNDRVLAIVKAERACDRAKEVLGET